MKNFILAIGLFSILSVRADNLPQVDNLLLDAQIIRTKLIPMLILFSEENCPYCEMAKNEVLIPISKLQQYKNKVIIREVVADSYNNFYDFYNNKTNANDFRFKYVINFYPTVIFLDDYGNKLSSDVIGIINPEFYWQKIDKKIIEGNFKLYRKRLLHKI